MQTASRVYPVFLQSRARHFDLRALRRDLIRIPHRRGLRSRFRVASTSDDVCEVFDRLVVVRAIVLAEVGVVPVV